MHFFIYSKLQSKIEATRINSSMIIEVIRVILNLFCFFFYEKILQAQKA